MVEVEIPTYRLRTPRNVLTPVGCRRGVGEGPNPPPTVRFDSEGGRFLLVAVQGRGSPLGPPSLGGRPSEPRAVPVENPP